MCVCVCVCVMDSLIDLNVWNANRLVRDLNLVILINFLPMITFTPYAQLYIYICLYTQMMGPLINPKADVYS